MINLTGAILRKYVPWLTGIRSVKCIERRPPEDGEYFIGARGEVFRRVGTATLTKAEQQKEYWIVEVLDR